MGALSDEFVQLKKISKDENHQRKLGDGIRQLRQFLGMTQKKLAEKVGCKRQYISFFERGEFSDVLKNISMLKKIATVLGTTVLNLYDEEIL